MSVQLMQTANGEKFAVFETFECGCGILGSEGQILEHAKAAGHSTGKKVWKAAFFDPRWEETAPTKEELLQKLSVKVSLQ